ncbi:Nn.00g034990.m01.CDS01 [Neocucurbitaria sp. VM-36]
MAQKMRQPPEPHYSFTIPSVHDDTTLDCRVYHPTALNALHGGSEAPWKKRGIIMAHPYAPMGGSYDDRVVGIVVDEFLKTGWIVGTFNFRGAHGSKGRTSWSGKPELDDYSSFAAFFLHYMCYLQRSPTSNTSFTPEQSPISPQSHNLSDISHTRSEGPPIVILGGYSYGSLILKHLPPVPSILQPFSSPITGTAADEILLRAHKLADQSNLEWINLARDQAQEKRWKHGHEAKLSVTMGGEETSPEKRRRSREIRRSLEGGRSLDLKTRIRSLSHRRRGDEGLVTPPEEENSTSTITAEIRYLLISPLTPPISTLAAPSLGPKFWSRPKEGHQEAIGKHAALAIYGDQDIFASAKKTRSWTEQLKAGSGSQFTSVEVEGAGHFWVEMGVEEKLRTTLRDWEAGVRL